MKDWSWLILIRIFGSIQLKIGLVIAVLGQLSPMETCSSRFLIPRVVIFVWNQEVVTHSRVMQVQNYDMIEDSDAFGVTLARSVFGSGVKVIDD